jgi:suppressor for copper-sensitivity B
MARLIIGLAGLLAAGILGTGLASADVGRWVDAPSVKARLVATARADGTTVAALELQLEPGWKTYWRTPGEGGLAPVFDFSASWNLAGVEIGYPWPHRYEDGLSTTNVYTGRVMFLLELTPQVATAPTMLNVALDLGVCEVVCIPVRVETAITVSPGRVDERALAMVEEARTLVPGPAVDGLFAVSSVDVTAASPATVDLQARAIVPQAFGAELFVEGPAGWTASPARIIGRSGQNVVFAFTLERPADNMPIAGVELVLTAVSGNAAIEQLLTLK